jgi:hypothetical protein
MMSIEARVLRRYLLARVEPTSTLARDLLKTIPGYLAGDDAPVLEVLGAVRKVFNPNGRANGGIDYPAVPWLLALGEIKRRNVARTQDAAVNLSFDIERETKQPSKYGNGREIIAQKLTEYVKQLKQLDTYLKAVHTDSRIERDGFTIAKLPGVKDDEQERAIAALLTAAEAVRKKFPQVCYGEVYLSTHLTNASGSYVYNNDTLQLSVRAQRRFDDIYTIVHELGHRYDNKFVDKKLRGQFTGLSVDTIYETTTFDVAEQEAIADALVAMAEAHKAGRPLPPMSRRQEMWMTLRPMLDRDDTRQAMSAFMKGTGSAEGIRKVTVGSRDVTVRTGKILREPLAVTPYGATKVSENFAEAFAHYVLGMDLAPEFKDLFDQMH